MKTKSAIYAGSFDPLTRGHLWVIREAAELFDELTVAIGENPGKSYMFTVEQRQRHISEALKPFKISNINIEVIGNKFLVKHAEDKGISYLVRGIRGPNDFNYEHVMNQVNLEMSPNIKTIYLIPPSDLAQISSSMVKGLVGPSGWEQAVKKYVPEIVLNDLRKTMN